jgi:hypothetical protein
MKQPSLERSVTYWKAKLAENRILVFGWAVVLVNIIAIFFVIYAETQIIAEPTELVKTILLTLKHLLIGFLIFGLLSVVLETNNWVTYFGTRISEIITDDSYLKALSTSKLRELERKLFLVQFGEGVVESEDSFLRAPNKTLC